ncbi:DNA-binding response regulator [Cohnella cellulosilytica]|uniref:DNA-binding response regulator n=2 Tax=Cohnella cellulosilytica TaxID=986710 RepID=A0ABW2FK65_9BACL
MGSVTFHSNWSKMGISRVKHTALILFGLGRLFFDEERMNVDERFETEYSAWLAKHIRESRGERLRRLKTRHGFGEKLLLQQAWWPIVANLDFLYPEYEVIAPDGKYYYPDFVYLRSPQPTCLEADSFSSHARDADRHTFSRGLDRQNEIEFANCHILRFSIDKLKEDPLSCQQHIRRMMEQWYGEEQPDLLALPLYQREIVRLAIRSIAPITIAMACECLGKKRNFVYPQINELVKKNWLEPASGTHRIRSYRLVSRRFVH